MVAHILNIAVGLTFSGGFIDLLLFGILQGNAKTDWIRILPVGVIYFFLYYGIFAFLIRRLDLKTPGREEDSEETKLHTRADVMGTKTESPAASVSSLIVQGLGGRQNICDVDCCATRLRITVADPTLVQGTPLKQSGSRGIVRKGNGIQIIYGPQVAVIRSELEDFLEMSPDSASGIQNSPEHETTVFSPQTERLFRSKMWQTVFSLRESLAPALPSIHLKAESTPPSTALSP